MGLDSPGLHQQVQMLTPLFSMSRLFLLFSSTYFNTSSFVLCSVQLILFILIDIHISKASVHLYNRTKSFPEARAALSTQAPLCCCRPPRAPTPFRLTLYNPRRVYHVILLLPAASSRSRLPVSSWHLPLPRCCTYGFVIQHQHRCAPIFTKAVHHVFTCYHTHEHKPYRVVARARKRQFI